MMQFTVPQFIDVEDKIFGPITSRQFVIMLSGFMLMAVCYRIFDFSLFVTSSIIIFLVFGIFAFFRVNGMPFHFFVLNFMQTSKRPLLRVWNNTAVKVNIEEEKEAEIIDEMPHFQPKAITNSRLTELALIVDTQGAYRGEKESGKLKFDEAPEVENIKS